MKHMKYRLSAVISLFLIVQAAFAAGDAVPTPLDINGGTVVTAKQSHELLQNKGSIFIDARNPLNYGRGHLPGAIYIGYKAKSKKVVDFNMALDDFDLAKLPKDKTSILVFYSHGDTGWKSYKAAVMAIRSGYSRVHWMREGLAAWVGHGYPVEH